MVICNLFSAELIHFDNTKPNASHLQSVHLIILSEKNEQASNFLLAIFILNLLIDSSITNFCKMKSMKIIRYFCSLAQN